MWGRTVYMSMRSVTQGHTRDDSEGGSEGSSGAENGQQVDDTLRAHARSVVTKYLRIHADIDALKKSAAQKKQDLDALEPDVRGALTELDAEALTIPGLGGVDIVHQRRKAVVRVEDYMGALHSVDPTLATSIKQKVDAKRTFNEKEVLRVVKPKT